MPQDWVLVAIVAAKSSTLSHFGGPNAPNHRCGGHFGSKSPTLSHFGGPNAPNHRFGGHFGCEIVDVIEDSQMYKRDNATHILVLTGIPFVFEQKQRETHATHLDTHMRFECKNTSIPPNRTRHTPSAGSKNNQKPSTGSDFRYTKQQRAARFRAAL